MTDIESSRARELVGRAGALAPPMPDFAAIVASAESHADPRPSVDPSRPRGRRLILVAAAMLLLVSGTALLWSLRDQDAEQIITGDQEDPAPSPEPTPAPIEPAAWTTDSWPVLSGLGDLELRYALRGLDKSVGYTGPDGIQVSIQVFPEGLNEEPGPLSEEIEVNGDPGWIETSADGDRQAFTSVVWSRDGFAFFLTIEGLASVEQALVIAESVLPASEEDLPLATVSEIGVGTGPSFDVATVVDRGELVTLQASTPEGFLFFLRLGPRGGGGGSPTLLGPGSLLEVEAGSGPAYTDLAAYGLVDQSVASLSLRLSDGSRQDLEIQSRSLGYDVAFFLAIVQAPDTAAAIDAYGEDGALLDSFDLSVLAYRPDLEAMITDLGLGGPTAVTLLQTSVEGFVTDTLGWELTEDTIEEIAAGTSFLVTDPDTQSRLRITMASEGAGISSVTPEPAELTVAAEVDGKSFGVSFSGVGADASSATLYVATRGAQIQRTLSEAQFADGSITIDLFAPTDEADLDYLLVFEDASGRVISAFSPG